MGPYLAAYFAEMASMPICAYFSSFSEDDPRLNPLLDLACSSGMILVAGAPVRVGPLLHIGAFVLGPDRTTRLYTKRRLGAFPPGAACDSLAGSVHARGSDRVPTRRP